MVVRKELDHLPCNAIVGIELLYENQDFRNRLVLVSFGCHRLLWKIESRLFHRMT